MERLDRRNVIVRRKIMTGIELKLTLKEYDRLVSRLENGRGDKKILVDKDTLNALVEDYVNLLNEYERQSMAL